MSPPLHQALAEYLGLRRALGFQLRDAGACLEQFVGFAEQEGAEVITTELALRWAQQTDGAQPARRARRLGMVRHFAQHLRAQDPRTQVPAKDLLPVHYHRPMPYIYSDEEIEQLVQAAWQLPSATGLRSATYATYLGLLAVTGMRMGEAVDLDRKDVDLSQGVLTLRRTKFAKIRYVPLHPSTQKALEDYQACRDRIYPVATPSFFLSEQGRRLIKCSVHATFYELSRQIGLREPGQSHGPRLHDLRHRFAVKTLMSWYRAGIDVQAQLPKLATYLGHTDIRHTYWYLTAVPELLQEALARLEEPPEGWP